MKEICKNEKKGGPWDCFYAWHFFGWEAEKVVVVTAGGDHTLELLTRAKTQLILILVESENEDWKMIKYYTDYQKYFQDAADIGLVEMVANSSGNGSES